MNKQTLYEMLQQQGISRRGFLKYCTALTSLMALPPAMIPTVAKALESAKRPSVIWLSFQECTGCTESLTRSHSPTVEGLIFDHISLDYHHTLQAASGDGAEHAREQAIKDNYGKYVGILGHKVNLAIGQGEILVTPLQICAYYSALGNDGIWRQPHLLDKKIEAEETYKNNVGEKKLPISEATLKLIQSSLYKTVNESYGTGIAASISNIKVYGKTGSAENHMGKKTHSWFSGYAKCEKFEIGFDIFVENGGHGGSVSAPIARRLINYYYGIMK